MALGSVGKSRGVSRPETSPGFSSPWSARQDPDRLPGPSPGVEPAHTTAQLELVLNVFNLEEGNTFLNSQNLVAVMALPYMFLAFFSQLNKLYNFYFLLGSKETKF